MFLIAHWDIPWSQLMAPLRSNLVQYSPHQAARAVSDIDFTFTKHFQDGLLTLLSSGCLNHFLVIPVHQMPIAQTVLTSPLSASHCAVAPCHLQGMDHPVICLQYSEYLTPQYYELENIQCSQARHLPTANLSN